MQVVVDGLLTEYQRQGKGKALLILPGWGDSIAGHSKLASELAATYDVVVVDLPGFGKSQPPETAWGLTDYASFLSLFLQKIGLVPEVIIGHSNGGAIAIRGLGTGILRADKLVLLASAGVRNEYKGRIKAIRLITKAGKALTAPLPHAVKRRLRTTVYKTIGSDMLIAEHMQATFKKIVNDDVQAEAAKLTIPTLLIYGDKDDATPLVYARKLAAAIKGSRLEILPDTAHFVHQEQPAKVVALIREFLR